MKRRNAEWTGTEKKLIVLLVICFIVILLLAVLLAVNFTMRAISSQVRIPPKSQLIRAQLFRKFVFRLTPVNSRNAAQNALSVSRNSGIRHVRFGGNVDVLT